MRVHTDLTESLPTLLRVSEAAKMLHVHPNTLRAWASSGLIHSYRIGSRGDRRFSVDELATYLEINREELEDQGTSVG